MNKITGTLGKLGIGKTLYGIIWLYDGYCSGRLTLSNLKVNFPHKALKTLEEMCTAFILSDENESKLFYEKYGLNSVCLLDELWKLADNRRCMDLLTELVDSVLLSSRKVHIDVYYTQQFLQIDPRIVFVTNEWILPQVYPKKPTKENPPELLVIRRYDGEFHELPPMKIDVRPYLCLYDSDENPYIIKEMISTEKIAILLAKIKEKQES